MSHHVGVNLYLRHELLNVYHKLVEEFCLKCHYLLVSTEYFLLVFLQFLSDIPLGLSQGLLSHPLCRYLVLIRIPNLQIVAEDVVVAHFQRCYSRSLALSLLYLEQISSAVMRYLPQLVQLLAVACSYDITLSDKLRRVWLYLPFYPLPDALAQVQLLTHHVQSLAVGFQTGPLYRSQSFEGRLQLHHLPW